MYIIQKPTFRSKRQALNIFVKQNNKCSLLEYLDKCKYVKSLQRCGFCNRVSDIKEYSLLLKDNNVFIIDIIYKKSLNNCYRKGDCSGKALNSNSKEYVMITHNLKSLEEANKYILSRNKSPFYRNNYNSDKDYSKAQARTEEWFNNDEKWQKYKQRQAYTNSLEYFVEKLGKTKGTNKYNYIQKQKNNSSLQYFINKCDSIEEAIFEYKVKCKSADSNSYNFLVNKLGKNEADKLILYRKTKKYFIDKYGVFNGTKIYNSKQKKLSGIKRVHD